MPRRVRRQLSAIAFAVFAVFASGAGAQDGRRSIVLVIDASGSMRAELPGGGTRMDAAKAAVITVVGSLPAGTRLALRAYGHQSVAAEKNCRDSALLVRSAPVETSAAAAIAAVQTLEPRGYTPITYSLGLAARDFGDDNGSGRTVILVSDGAETCPGDPCATARALKAAGADLTVHTIGFGVDAAARRQLLCVAATTGGQYFDAGTLAELTTVLGEAVTAPAVVVPEPPAEPATGRLRVENAQVMVHAVTDATTGAEVGSINFAQPELELAPGIYTVSFGSRLWKSIEVESGATTVLRPAVLEIRNPRCCVYPVVHAETGETLGELSNGVTSLALVPETVAVEFQDAVWPDIVLEEGRTTVLEPAQLVIAAMPLGHYELLDPTTGAVLGFVSEGEGGVSLPPMRLTLRLNGTLWPGIELTAGATTEVDPAVVDAVNLDVGGLDIVDVETGAKLTELSAGASQAALAPGRYGLSQNGVVGRTLDLLAGDRVTITLGTLILVGGDPVQHVVRNARGEQVAILWDAQPRVSLLAGTYTVGEGDNASVVTVREGKTSEVTLK